MISGSVFHYREFLNNLFACFNLAEDLKSASCKNKGSRDYLQQFKDIP